jgi:hypothetical protein
MLKYQGPTKTIGGFLVRDEPPPAPPRGAVRQLDPTHLHIHFDDLSPPGATSAGARTDQAGPKFPLRMSQHGSTGEWSIEDAEGTPLRIRAGANGGFEIHHAAPDNEGGEVMPIEQQDRRGRDRLPGFASLVGDGTVAGVRRWQDALDAHYRQQ